MVPMKHFIERPFMAFHCYSNRFNEHFRLPINHPIAVIHTPTTSARLYDKLGVVNRESLEYLFPNGEFFIDIKTHFRTGSPYALWGERRGSNPRQPESQSGTLPTELRPPYKIQDYSFCPKNLSKNPI